ncbi:pseudouridine synthase pus4 [Savitreella phatthalungensis]
MSGVFAINKPSGSSSAACLDYLKLVFSMSPMFADSLSAADALDHQSRGAGARRGRGGKRGGGGSAQVKMGHGGTLDPLADGVLVVGIGNGTRKLQAFLDCTKEYEAVALFGCSTDTYDAEGKILERASTSHLTRDLIESKLEGLRGNITQTPPIYSAIKMQGQPLYWYARNNKPLPEPIKPRNATVSVLEMLDYTTDHTWRLPESEAEEDTKLSSRLIAESLGVNKGAPEDEIQADEADSQPTKRVKLENGHGVTAADASSQTVAVKLRMTVSGGTYVRSLIHDLGKACGSAAHMVALTRTRVADHELKDALPWKPFETGDWEDTLATRLEGVKPPSESLADPETMAREFVRLLRPRGITLTYARTSDGFIAGPDRKPMRISGSESMRMTHHLRRVHRQIAVGSGTFQSDDPGLNAREADGTTPMPLHQQPEPFVLDPRGKLAIRESSKLWQLHVAGSGKKPVHLVGEGVDVAGESVATVEQVGVSGAESRFAWRTVRDHLQKTRKDVSLMVEGGAAIINDLLAHPQDLDLLIVTVSPKTVGAGIQVDLQAETEHYPVIAKRTFGQDTVYVRKRRRLL